MKYSIHDVNPYGYKLIIATIEDEDQKKDMEEEFCLGDNSADRLAGVYVAPYQGWKAILVFFNFNLKQSLTYGMVSHECLHIVDTIFNGIGHDYNVDNNEVGCYLIEWLVDRVLDHISRKQLLTELSFSSKLKDNGNKD